MKMHDDPSGLTPLSREEILELARLWSLLASTPAGAVRFRDVRRRFALERRLVARYVQPDVGRTGWAGVIMSATGEVLQDHGIVLRPMPRQKRAA